MTQMNLFFISDVFDCSGSNMNNVSSICHDLHMCKHRVHTSRLNRVFWLSILMRIYDGKSFEYYYANHGKQTCLYNNVNKNGIRCHCNGMNILPITHIHQINTKLCIVKQMDWRFFCLLHMQEWKFMVGNAVWLKNFLYPV